MQVCEIMRHDPVVCFPDDTAEMAARTMREHGAGILPVVRPNSGGQLIGVVTDRDLCLRVVGEGRDPLAVKVSECMTSAPVCCGPRDDIQYALLLMREHQVRRLPVVDSDYRIGGMVCFSNLVNSYVLPETLVETLRATCYPVHRELAVAR